MVNIWDEKIWFPTNITWKQIELINSGGIIPSFVSATDCLYMVFLLTIIRHFFKNCIAMPHGLSLGLCLPKFRRCEKIPLLEQEFLKKRRLDQTNLKKLSKSLDMDIRKVEIWFRKRRNEEKSPTIIKFVESEWKFCYYLSMFLYGLYVLHDEPFFWDVRMTMLEYPNHILTKEIHWYYMIELGYYTASLGWIFYEVKRSDFMVLFGHHFATVFLMLFSYIANYHRIGATVLIVHDVADFWMEGAKMAKYVNKHKLSEILFVIFVIVWIVSRLTYFPFWVIHATCIFGLGEFGYYPVNCALVGFLYVLQILHIYWFYLIIKIVIQVKTNGSMAKDCRSESDISDVTTTPPVETDQTILNEKNNERKSLIADQILYSDCDTVLNGYLHSNLSNKLLNDNNVLMNDNDNQVIMRQTINQHK